jgi:hypothetical protein
MLARQAVLLTPSKSSRPSQLLSRQHFAFVSPLAATPVQLTSMYCKQKTYAISKSFTFNIYKKQGVEARPFDDQLRPNCGHHWVTDHDPRATFSTDVLVHRYFAKLNRFCTRSPIVPWAPPGYTLSLTRRTSLTGSERRTTQRFSMRLPLTVRWTTGAAVGETSTESRDVSSRGVYFFLQKDVKEGSPVEILLTLPNEITLAGPVRVRCLGRVQRTESRDEGAVGVVAAIERYEFLRGDEEK